MSGIVGLFRTDGESVDPELIGLLTESLSFRGPDSQNTWVKGAVAFGHTMLRTTEESKVECQPFTLDGEVWIVADARVDARIELVRELDRPSELLEVPDSELILHAYLRWGESCVEHLLGDFAFGIWDGRSRRLFCARDHMGVKPFYYSHRGPWFIFSNTLDCLRAHPCVADRLNDLAIADFLLFGCNQDPTSTSFNDIQRLPAAHSLICSSDRVALQRYWRLPIEEPIYYQDDSEYLGQFNDLLRQAVSDRLRTSRASVFMSGGLDSPLLAATAVDLLRAPHNIHAFTIVYDHLIPDAERRFAGLVAEHLGIPIRFFAVDESTNWAAPGARITPEPLQNLLDPAALLQYYSAAAAHSRVALYGEGPDNALTYEWRPHLAWLARQRRWGRLLLDVVMHLREHKRIPLLPTVPRMFREWRGRKQWEPIFPLWLKPDLVERLQLRERWRAFQAGRVSQHPVRPESYSSLEIPEWPALFEELEPPYTGSPLEFRYPYLDLRLLRFLLGVPAVPWCRRKQLLRRASVSRLPEAVWRRPKTPLQRNPAYELAALRGLPRVRATPRLEAYCGTSVVSSEQPLSVASFAINLRATGLNYWLWNLDNRSLDQDNVRGGQPYEPKNDKIIARST